MKARRYFALVSSLSVLASLLTMATPARADTNSCTSSTNNPHYSSPAGGAIAKATYKCTTSNVDKIWVSQILWKCPTSNVTKNKTWLKNNCVNKGQNNQDIWTPTANHQYERISPPQPEPGAQGTGWWILYNHWISEKNGNFVFHHHMSNVVYISV